MHFMNYFEIIQYSWILLNIKNDTEFYFQILQFNLD